MEFGYGERVQQYRTKVLDFMAEHVYPNEVRYYSEAATLGPWSVYPIVEALKAPRSARGPVEFIPARRPVGRRALKSRVRAPLRDHGPLPSRAGGL